MVHTCEPRICRTRYSSGLIATTVGVLVAGGPALAQDGRGFTITPTFSISESLTDNRNLSSSNKEAEATTQISPGIRISSRSGRVQGNLDYSLNALLYARDSSRSTTQNALAAGFVAELIDNHATLDVRSSISQQSISAFGVQSINPGVFNPNRTEVRTLSVSPSLRGKLGDVADLDGRLTWATTSNGSSTIGSSTNTSMALRASGGRGPFGWSADASGSTSDFDAGRRSQQRQSGLSLNYRLDVQWRANLRATHETNDVLSTTTQSRNSWSGGLEWTPNPELRAGLRLIRDSSNSALSQQGSRQTWGGDLNWTPFERTQLSFRRDRQFFGTSQSFTFQHRMPRSVFSFSDTRDISTNATGSAGTGVLSGYDQLFAQYAIAVPDPIQRDLFVRSLLGNLQGFLTNAVSLRHGQTATVLLQGQLTNISLTAYRNDSRRLDAVSTAGDDLSRAGNVRQSGHSVTVSYRLASSTGVNFGYNRSVTAGSGTLPGNNQRSFTLSSSTQLANRASLSLSLRHSSFDSAVQPYTENGATASLNLQF